MPALCRVASDHFVYILVDLAELSGFTQWGDYKINQTESLKGVAMGGPGVPVNSTFCKPLLTRWWKGGEKAMRISWP